MIISSIVLSFKRERAGGAGPDVEALRFAFVVLLASAGATVVEVWDCDVVAGVEDLPRFPNISGAEFEGAPEDDADVVVVSADLPCDWPRLGKKLVFGAVVEDVDAPLLVAALLVPRVLNRLELGAAVGDFTIPLGAAAVPEDFAKLNDDVDGCLEALGKSEGALVELADWLFNVDGPPRFENKVEVDLFSAGLPVAASRGWFPLLKRLA